MATIPSKANGDVFYAGDVYKYIDSLETNNNIGSRAGQYLLGSVAIPANTITSGIYVSIDFVSLVGTTEDITTSYYLRIGSATTIDNIPQIGGSVSIRQNTGLSHNFIIPGHIQGFHSGADWTIENYACLSAGSEAFATKQLKNITVMGF